MFLFQVAINWDSAADVCGVQFDRELVFLAAVGHALVQIFNSPNFYFPVKYQNNSVFLLD
jgi:hypothetical protein